MEAGKGVSWVLKSSIGCGRRSIVCKGKLSAERGREGRSKARGESGVKGGQNEFENVKEGLDRGNGIRDLCVENVAMLAEVRMRADRMKMMKGGLW